jgi:protein SCO1/2
VVSGLVSLLVGSAAVLAVFVSVDLRQSPESADRFAFASSDGGELPKLWHAPSFSLVDQHRRPVTLASLRGEPFVADFIFTQCTTACPILTSRMVMLQHALAGRRVSFVSFSVDPSHDTPDVLAAYASRWNAAETRWSLLANSDASLSDVSTGFRVATGKTHDDENPILHANLFFLVDAEGAVRGIYSSTSQDEMSRLAADARRLAPAPSLTMAPAGTPSGGLYESLGCPGCHGNPQVAPPLVNLRGAEQMLQDGAKVTIDDAYLRRAILDPGADQAAGYADVMPGYRSELSDAEVDALVAELDARRADAGPADAPLPMAIDPVCGMKVRASTDAPRVTDQGKALYFCSDTCRDKFLKNQARYAHEPVAGMKAGAPR